MASKAKAGRGTIVSIGAQTGATGTEVFVPIGEVMTSGFTGGAWGTASTSSFDSGVNEEFITTMRDNGELNLEANVVDSNAGQAALIAAYNTGFNYDFKVQLLPGQGQTTGTLYAFSALVQSYDGPKIGVKDVVTVSMKLKISGAITPTLGS